VNSPHLMQAELLVPETHEALVGFAANWIAMRLRAAIDLRGSCSLFLSGGKTPEPIYENLAALSRSDPIEWGKVSIYFVDERCVPADDPDSNYALARRSLIDRLPSPPAAVHRMQGEHSDPEQAAREYEALLPEQFDVVVLGMGADGHVASLFPHTAQLHEETRAVVVSESPVAPAARISLTLAAIRRARLKMILILGAEKAGALARALESDVDIDETPVQGVGQALWLLDQAAASQLSERHRPVSR